MERKINMDKLKQITLIISGVLLLGVGFMNYNSNPKVIEETASLNTAEERIGDVELVNSNAIVENNLVEGLVENEVSQDISSDEYFTKTKLERDTMYSKMLETYQKITENKDLSETQKSIAVQEIEKINKYQNAIMISENLIKNKGFDDAVILVNNDIINVVVKIAYLGAEDIR